MIFVIRNLDNLLSFLDVILFIVIVFISLFFAFLTMYKITIDMGAATELQKRNGLTWAWAFIFLSIANILNILWRYAISEAFWIVAAEDISVLFVNMALLLKIIHTEYQLIQYEMIKRYYFSFAALCLTVFTTIFTPDLIRQNETFASIYLILLTAGGSIFPIIFIYLAIKLEGSERKMAIKVLFGAFTLLVGFLIQPHNIGPILTAWGYTEIQGFMDLLLILCPILIGISMYIIYMSYIKSL